LSFEVAQLWRSLQNCAIFDQKMAQFLMTCAFGGKCGWQKRLSPQSAGIRANTR